MAIVIGVILGLSLSFVAEKYLRFSIEGTFLTAIVLAGAFAALALELTRPK